MHTSKRIDIGITENFDDVDIEVYCKLSHKINHS